ncbi:MAG TPA: NlpC/P60 family protein [Acidimicrobiales bacterium]|nr:NlpC/P60 family protein [Acidimicrobiales bacterium]
MMRRALPALVAAVTLVTAGTFAVAPAAGGDEIADKRAEAARLSSELDRQGERISVLAERYNNARLEAERVAGELASAKEEMAEADAEVASLRRRLKRQAVDSYVQGGAVPALAMLVSSRLEDDVAVRAEYVKSATSQVGDTIDELRERKDDLERRAGELAGAERASREALASMEGARAEAVAAHEEQEKLLARVKGELADLVAAEERRRAEAEARRVEAELAARRAREQAARDAGAREAARRATTTTTRPEAATSPKPAAPTTKPAPSPSAPPSSGAAAAVAEAERQLGKPYEWGGSGPDTFDCSGLTAWAWRAGGASLPHSSQSQYSATSRVGLDAIRPGDLLFYGSPIHHVGIYVGDGQMIEAPETGKNVRYASIYRSDFVGAGRVH